MLRKIKNYLYGARDRQRIAIALAKGTAARASREIDLRYPATWEFSGFSQNGEDGIIEVLRRHIQNPNHYFVEIGAADGIDNNTAWMAIVNKYAGLMIEGDGALVTRARRMVAHYSLGLQIESMFVDMDSAKSIVDLTLHIDPDVMSLDIDGNDYYVAEKLLTNGMRPKIFVVEFNSAFGPESRTTIQYDKNFVFNVAHPSQLYYGVSVEGWRALFESRGYRFVTVERKGVNAFFVDPHAFDKAFLDGIVGSRFAENELQMRKFRAGHEAQFEMIAQMPFFKIE